MVGGTDSARILRPAELPGLELMRARFASRSFGRHSHEGYGVGVIEGGALGFRYRGEQLVAPAGAVNTVNPDEPHDGHGAAPEGWAYRMFYFSADFLLRMAEDVAGRPVPLPFLTSGVIHDPGLAGLLLRAHALRCDGPSPAGLLSSPSRPSPPGLEADSLLLAAFARLLARHSYQPPALPRAGIEHQAVARVKERLRGSLDADLTLAELARTACLSPWHFIRVFARHTGLTPHAWLMQQRARAARELLLSGLPIAQAAAQTGFTDQSHLTRTLKRITGLTPGQFRNSVQEA